jgi:DNA modification methylase
MRKPKSTETRPSKRWTATTTKVLQVIRYKRSVTNKELARITGYKISTVNAQVSILRNIGVIRDEDEKKRSGVGEYGGARSMGTKHTIVFGDCRNMKEVSNESVHLMVTSPPYFNAPFDYPGLFKSYEDYLSMIKDVAKELKRVIQSGRIAAFVVQDVRINGRLYPVTADIIKIMIDTGFKYREKIIWRKPEGYVRISRRSGVLLQHPYPMYFYPDNLFEEILIFQNGEFDFKYLKNLSKDVVEQSKVNLHEFDEKKWFLTVWDITNVLPLEGRLEEGIAAFPEEIPRRLIKLYSFVGETVLDPFLGSGTTTKVAKELARDSIGYEIDLELRTVIRKKTGYHTTTLTDDKVKIIERKDALHLRASLQEKVKKQRSVTK